MKILKLSDIKEKDLPLIVLTDNRRGWIGFLIKQHSSGNYGHIMEMHKLTHFASQNFSGFKEVPVEKYLKPYITLKFWKYKGMTKGQKADWDDDLDFELSQPWWRRRYDFLGIFGQLLPGRWTRKLNNPATKYCSERVRDRLLEILNIYLPRHSTPSEWNQRFKKEKNMEVLGYMMEE